MIEYYNLHFLFSTVLGTGKLVKKGAGTIGSIIAFPIVLLFIKLSHILIEEFTTNSSDVYTASLVAFIFLCILSVIGVYSSGKYSRLTQNSDPKEVIIDEVIGQSLVVVATLPFTSGLIEISQISGYKPNIIEIFTTSCFVSFVLFRAYDIFKPWPIDYLDKNVKGGLGIVLDDICAAIFAIITYYLILFYVVIDWLLK